MQPNIFNAVVIGAGTMGGGIAAHLANAGVQVTLLDIIPTKLTVEEEKKGSPCPIRQLEIGLFVKG